MLLILIQAAFNLQRLAFYLPFPRPKIRSPIDKWEDNEDKLISAVQTERADAVEGLSCARPHPASQPAQHQVSVACGTEGRGVAQGRGLILT